MTVTSKPALWDCTRVLGLGCDFWVKWTVLWMIIDKYCLVFTLRLIVRLTEINFSIARLIAIKNFNRTAALVMTIARRGLKIKVKGQRWKQNVCLPRQGLECRIKASEGNELISGDLPTAYHTQCRVRWWKPWRRKHLESFVRLGIISAHNRHTDRYYRATASTVCHAVKVCDLPM